MSAARRYRMDDLGVRRRVVVHNGVEGYNMEWTDSCSGCFEGGENLGQAPHYPYDAKAQCYVGGGCDECGYTGKRRRRAWVPFGVIGVRCAQPVL